MKKQKDFPSSLVVRHYVSTAWDAGLIPDWELRFHVLWPKHLTITNKFLKLAKRVIVPKCLCHIITLSLCLLVLGHFSFLLKNKYLMFDMNH